MRPDSNTLRLLARKRAENKHVQAHEIRLLARLRAANKPLRQIVFMTCLKLHANS